MIFYQANALFAIALLCVTYVHLATGTNDFRAASRLLHVNSRRQTSRNLRPFASILLANRLARPNLNQLLGRHVVSPLAMAKRTTTTTTFPNSFDALGASPELCRALAKRKCLKPFEIQAMTWPWLRDSTQDVNIVAEAGSGKTVAYLLPLIERLCSKKRNKDNSNHDLYIVVPNRELQAQVMGVAKLLGSAANLTVADVQDPKSHLADIVVGTAAKAVSSLSFKSTPARTVVVDEADLLLAGVRSKKGGKTTKAPAEMIVENVYKAQKKIAKDAPTKNTLSPRIVIVSATMPAASKKTVGDFLSSKFPSMRWLRTEGAHRPVANLVSEFETVKDPTDRENALARWCEKREGRTLIFANSANTAKQAHRRLEERFAKEPIFLFTPDVPTSERETALRQFSKAKRGMLVSSGLAGRGLDLPDVQLVIEYEMATNMIDHVHRVGRTARAGRKGHAVSFVSPSQESEQNIMKEVERCRKGNFKYVG